MDSSAALVRETTIICGNCGAEVWWSMPRPNDPCPECEQPIGLADKDDVDRLVSK